MFMAVLQRASPENKDQSGTSLSVSGVMTARHLGGRVR